MSALLRSWGQRAVARAESRADADGYITSHIDRFLYGWGGHFAGVGDSWSPARVPFVAFERWRNWKRRGSPPSPYGLGHMWDRKYLGPVQWRVLRVLQLLLGA